MKYLPNLIDFFSEDSSKDRYIKMLGQKPCQKCDLNVEEYFWDEDNRTMLWTCQEGHETKFRVG